MQPINANKIKTIDTDAIIERYKPRIDRLGARFYSCQKEGDIHILRWWLDLCESHEIEKLILPSAHRLPEFYKIFQPPTVVLYTIDDKNEIENIIWLTPCLQSVKHPVAYVGLWCKPPVRGTRKQLQFAVLAYSLAFEFYSTLLAITWQPDLLDVLSKLGYTIAGSIPNYYDKPYCYIMHLTQSDFEQSRFAQIAKKDKGV